jgi:hypothetical protein
MSQHQLTTNQISAFAESLVKNGLIDKSDLEVNKDLIEEALRCTQNKSLTRQLYNFNPVGHSNLSVQTPAMSSYNGAPITAPVENPTEAC